MEPATQPPSAGGAGPREDERVPGLVVVFAGSAPAARALRCGAGGLELGRRRGAGGLDDVRVSRQHARIELDGGRWRVTDLGSQNGTFVDGGPIAARAPVELGRVLRVGDTLLVPCTDVRPIERAGVQIIDDFVRGPAMHAIVEEARSAARAGTTLHVRGETGSGKEGVVQAYHRAGPRAGRPLVAVNCAAIPHALAERLLFGVRRGAYSGADADAAGYLQEADGGTLFLDEVAELDATIQAKLLRVLESRELVPLGASRPRPVDFALCSATHKDLRTLVATGSWREDLYFRIARPAVTLPALRNRPEEIPALIAQELARTSPALSAHVSLIEQCLLRPWPGNARELLSEIRTAARAAAADGTRVDARHLADGAGRVFGDERVEPGVPAASDAPVRQPRKRTPELDDAWRHRLEDALRRHAGNVAATARSLGLHRTQVRRLIERHRITVDAPRRRNSDG